MGLNFSGALRGLGEGISDFGESRLNLANQKELDEARFIRDKSMAEFNSGLLDKRQIATETRATAARIATEDRAQSRKVANEERGLLNIGKVAKETNRVKREITISNLQETLGVDEDTAKKVNKAIEIGKLSPKGIKDSTKVDLWKMAQATTIDSGVLPESPNLFAKTKVEFNKLKKVFGDVGGFDISKFGAVDPTTGFKEVNEVHVLLDIESTDNPLAAAKEWMASPVSKENPEVAAKVQLFIESNSKKNSKKSKPFITINRDGKQVSLLGELGSSNRGVRNPRFLENTPVVAP